MVFEEEASSPSAVTARALWASMASWFTPTVLFVVINLVIGTIAVTSKSHNHGTDADRNREEEHQPRLISRGSSVLARLRSINLRRYTEALAHPAAATVEAAPAPPVRPADVDERETREGEEEEEEEEEYDGFETLEEAYAAAAGEMDAEFRRSQSDSRPVEVAKEKRKKQALRKSASTSTTVFRGYEAAVEGEAVEVKTRRTNMTRDDRRGHLAGGDEKEEVVGGGGEVDARADDFINRFRKQLQLQRLESILRYKEMLSRGK